MLRLCNTYTLLYLIPKRRCSGKHIFLRCLVTQYISEALRISIFKSKTQLLVAKSKKYTAKSFGENPIFQMSHKSCYLKAHQITLIRHKHTHKTTLTQIMISKQFHFLSFCLLYQGSIMISYYSHQNSISKINQPQGSISHPCNCLRTKFTVHLQKLASCKYNA